MNWLGIPFIKQKPLPGLIGLGGGATSLAVGGGAGGLGWDATGGTTSEYTAPPGAVYTLHKFTGDGTFTVNSVGSPGGVEALVIAGGGSGSAPNAGGGGGGGAIHVTGIPVTATGYTMTVGGGGSCPNPSTDGGTPGGDGGPSTAAFGSNYIAGGGGGGSTRNGTGGGGEDGQPIGCLLYTSDAADE